MHANLIKLQPTWPHGAMCQDPRFVGGDGTSIAKEAKTFVLFFILTSILVHTPLENEIKT